MVVLMLVSAALYGCLVFSYLFLWTVTPQMWPLQGLDAGYFVGAAALLATSSTVVHATDRRVGASGDCRALWLAIPLLAGAWVVSLVAQRDVSPSADGYGAVVHAFLAVDGFFVAVAVILALFALARHAAGRLDRVRRVTFDNAKLFWHYTVAQSLVGLALVHGFPGLFS
jgi:heme/copper-type cytochrome/quinol oxidase subunit 3